MIKKLVKSLINKNKRLKTRSKPLSQHDNLNDSESELTEYINYIFEHLEREKILRWLSDSIRNSLDLNKVLETTVQEVGKLLKVDRCLIALFNDEIQEFETKCEYRINDTIPPISDTKLLINQSPDCHRNMVVNQEPVILNDANSKNINDETVRQFYSTLGSKSSVIVPIIYNNKTIAAFSIHQNKYQRNWDLEHIEILKDIGDQIAIAIKQASLYLDLKKQAEREHILRKIITTIRSSLDIDTTLHNICDEVAGLFKADRAVIVEFPNKQNYQEYISRREYLANKEIRGFSSDFDTRVSAYWGKIVLEKGKPLALNDIELSDTPDYFKNNYLNRGIKSIVNVPISKDNDKWGTLGLSLTNPKIWTQEEISLLESIADQIYLAIKQAELHSITQKQAEREKTLRNIIENIRNTLDLDEVLTFICKEISEMFNVYRVGIGDFKGKVSDKFLLAEYKNVKNIKGLGDVQIDSRVLDYLYENVVEVDTILAIDNVDASDIPDYFRKYQDFMGIKAAVYVPLKDGKSRWGILVLTHYYNPRKWTTEELKLLEIIADQVAIAIRQASLYAKAQQAAQVKSEFLANMSHEFRTPLNAIIGFTDLILTGSCAPDKVSSYLQNVSKSGKHLLELVNDLLDISKIESGKMDLSYAAFNSKQVIHDVVLMLESLAMQKEINIKLHLADTNLNADMGRFRQIIYNLLSNAIKFTPEKGSIVVRSEINGTKLITMVEDTGIGIAKEDYDKIFTQFKQLDSSYVKSQGGTGLGLALTKKLVELHGGSIYFDSEKGSGSRFWFILPEAKALVPDGIKDKVLN